MRRRAMSRSSAWLMVHGVPVLILLGVFLPGVNQGWVRVDTGLYAGLSRWAYAGFGEIPFGQAMARWWFLTGPEGDYFNKPPLVFWIHGAFLELVELLGGGPSMWSLRVPGFAAGAIALLATIAAVRRVSGPRAAMTTGIVLALSLEFFRYTKNISLDLWLCALVMVGVWCAVRAGAGATLGDRPLVPAWLAACGVAFGLALLVKPLLALLPLALLIAWMLAIGLGTTRLGIVPVAAIAVALPWHASMIHRFGNAFLAEYVGRQAVARIATDAHGSAPWWYYLHELGAQWWPWLAFALLAIVSAARARIRGQRPALLLIGIWVIGWLIALSIASDKATRYSAALYPMLAWLAALWLVGDPWRWLGRRARTAGLWLGPGVFVGGLIMLLLGLRVHAPKEPQWLALEEAMRASPELLDELVLAAWQHPGDRAPTTLARAERGAIYWAYGTWPSIAEDASPLRALERGQPVLIVGRGPADHPETSAQLALLGRRVFAEGSFTLVVPPDR